MDTTLVIMVTEIVIYFSAVSNSYKVILSWIVAYMIRLGLTLS